MGSTASKYHAQEYYEFLLQASQLISEAENLTEGLNRLSQFIIKSLDTTFCCFLLLNKKTNQFQVTVSNFISRKKQPGLAAFKTANCVYEQEFVLKKIITGDKPVVYPDDQEILNVLNCLRCTANQSQKLKSAIITPLKVKGKVLGLFVIGEMRSEYRKRYTNTETAMIHTLANQVSTLIEKITLYETVKIHANHIDEQNRLLSQLDKASLKIRAIDDRTTLPHEIIGNAARMVNRKNGCFFTYNGSLQKLQVTGILNLPNAKINDEIDLQQSWLRKICSSDKYNFIPKIDQEIPINAFIRNNNLFPGIVIPIYNQRNAAGVMLISNKNMPEFTNAEIEVLIRFAAQASLAMHTSNLINSEQRIFGQFSTLRRISNYVQQSNDLEKMLNVILTGVTAGYGLGFNRAVLLLVEEEKKYLREVLAFGHKSKKEAENDWEKHHQNQLENFDEYIKWLELGKRNTSSLHESFKDTVFYFSEDGNDIFSTVLREKHAIKMAPEDFERIPKTFFKILQPAAPLVAVPLLSNNQPIGLILVDNKFSETPITDITISSLQAFSNTAAIAYEKEKHLREIEKDAQNRKILYNFTQELSVKKDMNQILLTLLDGGIQLLKVEMAVAHLKDELTGKFVSYSVPEELTSLFTEPRKDIGLTNYIINKNDYLQIPDTAKDERVNPATIELGIQSMVGFPLKTRGKVIGALFFNSRKKQIFEKKELAVISLMIAQCAVTIENTRVFESSKKNAIMRKALVLMSQDLTETPQIQLQMEMLWQFVRDKFKAPMFYIGFFDELKNEIDFQIFYDMYIKQPPFQTKLNEDTLLSPVGFVLSNGKPLIWNCKSEKDQIVQNHNLKLNIKGKVSRSSLIYPLLGMGKVNGIIAIQSDCDFAWDEIEQSAFQSLAQLVSVSIQNSNLIKETNEGNALLEAAFSASKDITSSLDPDQTLREIVQKVCTVMNAFRTKVIIMDTEGNPQDYVSHGYDEQDEQATLVRPHGISHKVITSKQAIHIENLGKTQFHLNPAMYEQGVRAASCTPLIYRDKARGVLWVDYKAPRYFTPNEKKTLQLFANHVTTAYENARQIRELSYMQQAAETLSSTFTLTDTLNQIARSAQDVLGVHSAAIWSYDQQRNKFNYEESVASGIPKEIWEQYRKEELLSGRTAQKILESEEGWVGIKNISDTESYPFLGQSTQKLLKELAVKSFQGIRLEVGKDILGILYLNYARIRNFAESGDKKSARTFANHAALALKNSHLLEQISNTHRIAGAVANLTVLGEIEETKTSIINGTLQALDCDVVSLFSYDQECRQFDFPPKMVGVWNVDQALKTNKFDNSAVPYKIIQRGEFYITENTSQDPIMGGDFAKREQVQASVGCPLIIRDPNTGLDQIVGVMCVNYRHKHNFLPSELEEIKTFAHQAGIAIYNAQLYKRLNQRASALETMNEAGKIIIQSLELGHILNRIAEQAWHLTGEKGKHAASALIILVEKNTAKFIAGYPTEKFTAIESKFPHGIDLNNGIDGKMGLIGTAIKLGISQLSGNIKEDSVYIELDQHTNSELVVPIKFANKVIGAINVEHHSQNVFDKDDQRDLESLAAFAGIAIDHANKFNTLKELKAYIGSKTAMEWVRMVSESWGHSIDRDCGTAAAIIERIERNLAKKYETAFTEDIQDLITIIDKIKSTRMIAPLTIEDADSNVEINQLLKTYLDRKFKQYPHHMIKLCYAMQDDLDQLATVRASIEWVRRTVEILVDNAVDAMISADSPQKQLTIITKLINGKIHITFKDRGPGFPEELIPKIGIEPVCSEKGAGVGLTLASNFVQCYKGQLSLDKTDNNGAEISIIFPANLREPFPS